MIGKLLKALSGLLGGTAALTAGGIFLKNHLNELHRQETERQKVAKRLKFLSDSDEAANKLNQSGQAYGHLLFKSDTSRELAERSWVIEIGDGKWRDATQYTKEEMLKYERELWEEINDKTKGAISRYIAIDEEKKKEIEEKYQDYWERYYEACLAWNISRDGDKTFGGGSNPICTVLMTQENYEKKEEYKKYKELKEKGLEMGSGEFYWTIWRKFQDKKKSDLGATGANESQIFDEWIKTERGDLFKNIK